MSNLFTVRPLVTKTELAGSPTPRHAMHIESVLVHCFEKRCGMLKQHKLRRVLFSDVWQIGGAVGWRGVRVEGLEVGVLVY